MKRKISGLFLVILISTMAYSASITITSPKTGDVWCINQAHTIEWTATGQMDANVRIRLLNHPTLDVALAIDDTIPTDDGSYTWTIPATVTPGSYRIRVRTMDAAVFKDSEMFEITNCSNQKPDLVVRDLEFYFSDSSYYIKTQPLLKGRLFNIGQVTAPVSYTRARVTGPGGFVGKSTYRKSSPVEPNDSEYVGFSVKLPRPGNYTYKVRADYDGRIDESNEDNNKTTITYYLPPCTLPDLTVAFREKKESLPGVVKKTVYAVVKNIGQSSSSACKLGVYVYRIFKKAYPIPSLAPGQKSRIVIRRYSESPMNPKPEKKIEIRADYLEQVAECYEDNNFKRNYSTGILL